MAPDVKQETIEAAQNAVSALAAVDCPTDLLVPITGWIWQSLCQIAGCSRPREVTFTLRDGAVIAVCSRHQIPMDAP